MNVWAALLLIAGGLFAGSVVAFAWDRVSAWRSMPLQQFMTDFGHTINRADKIQPALLVVAIAAAVGYGLSATGSSRILALVGAAGFLVVMVASLGILVPLQRRILRTSLESEEAIREMQQRWFSGHIGRTALSVVSFGLVVTAAALDVDS
jgi:hypothetical protein